MTMKKLELKHVSSYPMGKEGVKILLPKHQFRYGKHDMLPLNGVSINTDGELQLEMLTPDNDLEFTHNIDINKCRLVLHPLSDLTKEIEVNGEGFVPIEKIKKLMLSDCDYMVNSGTKSICYPNGDVTLISINDVIADECPIGIYNKLLEWHFDVFGLIEKGLAIDINTL